MLRLTLAVAFLGVALGATAGDSTPTPSTTTNTDGPGPTLVGGSADLAAAPRWPAAGGSWSPRDNVRSRGLPDEELDRVFPFYRFQGVSQTEAEALLGSAIAAVYLPDAGEVRMLATDNLEAARLWLARRVEEEGGKLLVSFGPPNFGIESKMAETGSMALRSFLAEAVPAGKGGAGARDLQYLVKAPAHSAAADVPVGPSPTRLPVQAQSKESWYIYQDFEGDVWQYWSRSDNTGGQYTWGIRSCDSYSGSYSADAPRGGAQGATLSCSASSAGNLDLYMYSEACQPLQPSWKAYLELRLNEAIAQNGGDEFCVLAAPTGGQPHGWCFWGTTSNWVDLVFNLRQWYMLGDLGANECNTVYLEFESDSLTGSGFGARVDDLLVWYGDTTGSAECSIIADPTGGAAPLTVAFRAVTDIYSADYWWRFGDDTTSDALDPAHVFSTAGDYYVTLGVYGNYGTSCHSSVKIHVTPGSCTYQISPTSASYSYTGGTGAVSVDASASSCGWSATSNAYWVTITGGTSGTGDGTVRYSVSANSGSSTRTGTLTIAARTFTVTQTGTPSCTTPTITTQPSSQTIARGATATLSVTATGTAPLTYQWYRGQSADASNPISGATAATYTTAPLTSTTSYWVRVSNTCGQADSNTATITVPACTTPTITSHPSSQSIPSGSTATLSVTATGTTPFAYQWYRGQSGSTSNPISGATAATYTTPALTATTSYWVRVSNDCGQADSSTATVTVTSGSAYVYWIPAVTHAAGVQGSQWRADVGALNRGSAPTNLGLTLYTDAQNVTATSSVGTRDQAILADVVGQTFGLSASGLLKIEATQPLTVTARVYNQAPEGTFGQGVDGFTTADTLASGGEVYLPLLAQNASFRTNIGFSNISSSTATVVVTLYLGDGTALGSFTVDIPAWRWKQDNEPYRVRFGRTDVTGGYAKIRVDSGSGVSSYASVVDNSTGDPTTVVMRP